MISQEELLIPEKFKDTHYPHIVDGDWHLVSNNILTDTATSLDDEIFECWIFNSKGVLLTGIPYMMSKAQLGFTQ